MTVEEYKALAKVVSYDELARNPKGYLKTIVKLRVEACKQVMAFYGLM